MNTRAKARRLLEEEEEEEETEIADGSDEEGEAAANGSASEDDDEEQVEEEEEENDELEDDDLSEAEELEEGDGDDYEQTKLKSKWQRQESRLLDAQTNSSRKRKAIEELSRSASEDSSSVARVPASKASARKITLRISPSKNGKGKMAAKEKRTRQSKTTIVKQPRFDEEEDDEEEEEEENGDAEGSIDSWDDFENDQSFAQLPKTARQLAKEKANQGTTESGSELQELPVAEDSSKKSKLTESEIALRKVGNVKTTTKSDGKEARRR